jgi:hypothetical protein
VVAAAIMPSLTVIILAAICDKLRHKKTPPFGGVFNFKD